MGKIETYTKNRIEGALWALKIAEKEETAEEGLEALRKELKFRNITMFPMELPRDEIEKVRVQLAGRILNTMMVVLLQVFEEEYDWRGKRLHRLAYLFNKYSAQYLAEDPFGERYINMSDMAQYFKEEYGINFNAEALDDMVDIEELREKRRVKRVQWDMIEKHLKNSHPEALEHLRKVLEI